MNGELHGRSLLAVFAHPDDESLACGGLLAWCAHLGARVSLVCATRGESGTRTDGDEPGDRPAGIRDTRSRELQAAAEILGLSEVVLLDHPDGMLPWVDAARLERDIGDAIRRIRPDVVITFGEDGLYWHPDHIAIHERTTAAVVAAAAVAGEKVPALYYVTMPPGCMRALVTGVADLVAAQGAAGLAPRLIFGIDDADAFGAMAATPTLIVDASGFAPRKLAAIKCHRSQLVDSALALVSEQDAARFLGIEHFRRADAGSTADAFIERFANGA
jgi:LmbE family N-acetylglucosaminyl deacetylase